MRAGVHTIEHGFWLSDFALEVLKAPDRALVPTLAALICMRRMSDLLPDEINQKLIEAAIPHGDSIRRAHAAGCCIATGTDAGTPGNPHGNIGVELQVYVITAWMRSTAGVPPRATAQALGLDGGSLQPGKRDLIALSRARL